MSDSEPTSYSNASHADRSVVHWGPTRVMPCLYNSRHRAYRFAVHDVTNEDLRARRCSTVAHYEPRRAQAMAAWYTMSDVAFSRMMPFHTYGRAH